MQLKKSRVGAVEGSGEERSIGPGKGLGKVWEGGGRGEGEPGGNREGEAMMLSTGRIH